MPRYFFHMHYKTHTSDDEGFELPDLDTAWRQGSRMAGLILHDMDGKLEPGREWRLEVADEAGKMLFAVRFSAEFYDA